MRTDSVAEKCDPYKLTYAIFYSVLFVEIGSAAKVQLSLRVHKFLSLSVVSVELKFKY